MKGFSRMLLGALVLLFAASGARAEQPAFRWVSFHAPEDVSTVEWVKRSLAASSWSSIREIGVLYDAALVVTTERPGPQSTPASDTFTVWSVSLTSRTYYKLLQGAHFQAVGLLNLGGESGPDLGVLYDNGAQGAADSYFTAFHYSLDQHMWMARWMRGEQAVPLWSATPPTGVDLTQLYAVVADPSGRHSLITWKRLDYGKSKPAEEFLYQYDVDPDHHVDRTRLLYGKELEMYKLRLCSGQSTLPGLARGQDGPLCRSAAKPRAERRPTTTPPANNYGRSAPGARR